MGKIEFTDIQQQIIDCDAHKIGVRAVAGSGKTTTLVARINRLIGEGIDKDRIFVATFTRRMANELQEKLPKMKFVGTYHSLFYSLLKQHQDIINYPWIDIVSEVEDYEIIHDIISDNSLSLSVPKARKLLIQYFLGHKIYNLDFDVFQHVFLRFMRNNGLMNYDLIEYYMLKLLQSKKGDEIRNMFDYFFLDEFHDTSENELNIFNEFKPKNIFCVYDHLQCIYEWRNSNPDNINIFESQANKIFDMDISFRCPPSVSKIANDMVTLYKQDGYLKSFKKEGLYVDIINTKNVFQDIKKYLDKYLKFFAPEEIYILCRTNHHVELIANSLRQDYPVNDVKDQTLSSKYLNLFLFFIRMKINLFSNYYTERFIRSMKFDKDILLLINQAKKEKKKIYDMIKDDPLFKCYLAISQSNKSITEKARAFYDIVDIPFHVISHINEILEVITMYEKKYGSDEHKFIESMMEIDPTHLFKKNTDITIATVHQVKGKEADVVIIPWVGTDYPHPRSPLQEEIRLFYVAITRAKKKLILLQTNENIFTKKLKR